MKRLPGESGQALLLVLLSVAVVLTIVLSVVSRTITDISVVTKEEEALRAFSAAEAGVERVLIIGSDIGPTKIGDASFTAKVSSYSSGSKEYPNPVALYSGESAFVWFVAHAADGSFVCNAQNPCFSGSRIKVCWGKPGTASNSQTTPAVEVSIFYAATPGDLSTVRIARDATDPNSDRRGSNNFSAPDTGTCQVGGTPYAFQKSLNFTSLGIPSTSYQSQNGLQFARIRMIYNSDTGHQVGSDVNFAGNSLLPAQGSKIESLGSAGSANRKIEVFQLYGEPPPIFDSSVFSLGGLSK